MTHQLNEDDLYRSSTQYRLWSFAPNSLASLRKATHDAAIERAKTYLDENVNGKTEGHVSDCPTLEEETRLIQRYSDQIRSTCDHFKWPINVKATAVQYLRRFYLTNSIMTYPPKEIYKSILFLASKTEGTHNTLAEFARRISTAPEQILAPEYKIIQALRFTLDVRQPYRGLKGALMELLNLAQGTGIPAPHVSMSATELQEKTLALPSPPETARTSWKMPPSAPTQKDITERAHAAYACARHYLDAPALLTDMFFLYTPPQMYLGALRLADPVLTDFYLETKLPSLSNKNNNDNKHHDTSPSTTTTTKVPEAALSERILSTIRACGALLGDFSHQNDIMTKEDRSALETRLERCRDPATRDMVGLNAKVKRDGNGGLDSNNHDDHEAVLLLEKGKRRKLEREKSIKEGEDLFGPSLK